MFTCSFLNIILPCLVDIRFINFSFRVMVRWAILQTHKATPGRLDASSEDMSHLIWRIPALPPSVWYAMQSSCSYYFASLSRMFMDIGRGGRGGAKSAIYSAYVKAPVRLVFVYKQVSWRRGGTTTRWEQVSWLSRPHTCPWVQLQRGVSSHWYPHARCNHLVTHLATSTSFSIKNFVIKAWKHLPKDVYSIEP